jgi:histidine triad (HIT) family protein
MSSDPDCIFCKIVAGRIPAKKAYEDDDLLAFHDIQPWGPVHVLIIPKRHIESMEAITDEHQGLLGRMMVLAPKLMRENGVSGGFRQVINTGRDGLQEVMHLHMHVIGGPRPWNKG